MVQIVFFLLFSSLFVKWWWLAKNKTLPNLQLYLIFNSEIKMAHWSKQNHTQTIKNIIHITLQHCIPPLTCHVRHPMKGRQYGRLSCIWGWSHQLSPFPQIVCLFWPPHWLLTGAVAQQPGEALWRPLLGWGSGSQQQCSPQLLSEDHKLLWRTHKMMC